VTGPSPRRIVSLVPSLTEALFALELGDRVVGVTEWCCHPEEGVRSLPRVGGTKDVDVEAVKALAPDLVIANREENTQRAVRGLRESGLAVWVTYPKSVREGVALLHELAALGAPPQAAARVVGPAEEALRAAEEARPARRPRVFCPIWHDPWMAVGGDTYAGDLLALCGGANVFAERGDRRYPRVSPAEIQAAQPEVVLLPDEPYRFGPAEMAELVRFDLPAARSGRIHLVDGTLVSWYGPRIPLAIECVRTLLAPREEE
jgi:ABC-type Fe3+-hydroxamate transport system substrate-binding protein